MFENILIATDDSQLIKNAIKYTANAFPNSQYHVLNVVYSTERSVPTTDMLMKDLKKASKRAIKDGIDILHEMGVDKIKKSVREGVPSKQILTYSKEHDIDMIVMGTQSKSGIQSFEIGDTCLHTLENSSIPILLFDSIVDIIKPKDILHPSSGSKYSIEAGYLAIELAEHFSGRIKVLCTRGDEEKGATFRRLETFAEKNNVSFEISACTKKPNKEIVRESKKNDLVVTSRGRPGLKYKLRKVYPPFALGKLERGIIVETRKPVLFVGE
ncbi:MAG: universal stress protein [Candidatus Saliniplasma sp.]